MTVRFDWLPHRDTILFPLPEVKPARIINADANNYFVPVQTQCDGVIRARSYTEHV